MKTHHEPQHRARAQPIIRNAGSIVALTAFLLASSAAGAQSTTFAGTTSGSFSNSNPALSFRGSTFDAMTAGGALDFGSAENNFGTFTLDNRQGTYAGSFDLLISFAAPTGIDGGQTQSFEAMVNATLNPGGNGLVLIDFDNSPITRMFNGEGSGSFALSLNDVAFRIAGNSQIDPMLLTGRIVLVPSGTEVPEPTSFALMGVGATILLLVRRKRRARA